MIVKGAKINDRYQIIKTLGEGGMANVYLAYDTILNRNVAVKVLRGDLASDEKFVRRFQREALSASNLSHPNIVEMYDFGEEDGQNYIVMEYVPGKTLKQLIKKRGTLTVTEVIDIMLQLTDGMAHAHDSYIIHRDIKPQNIMILENGMIKITDFGIAMALNETQLTQTNSVMGSVHYLAPEQVNGKGSTIRSDIYSMGIVMFELLTGVIPYKGDSAVEIALKHLKEPLPSIRKLIPDLPQTIENIILKSTAKNPKNRYADAREMYDDIKTALDDSRANEKRCVYKYSETDLDETKVLNDTLKEAKKINDKQKEEKREKENKRQNKVLIILLSVFAGLIIITASVILLLPKIMSQKNIAIPDVTAKSMVEASNILTKAGFTVAPEDEIKYLPDENIEEGYVVKTSPAVGKIVKEGSKVVLYISSGDETFTMEDYTGKNYIETKTLLETMYKCNVMIDYKKVSEEDKKEADTVLETKPEAGTKLKQGDTVTLIIPEIEKKYPDFTSGNYTVDDVKNYCKENSLTIAFDYLEIDSVPEGTIIKQSRPAGTVVLPGTTFTITLSKTPTAPEEDVTENETEATENNE